MVFLYNNEVDPIGSAFFVLWTASTAIDPMPLPTYLRRDDIPVEACQNLAV